MNGALEFYKACKKNGIKPILGFEAYLVDDVKDDAIKFERNHLTLLARNDVGFRNLVKLSSAGFLEGLRRGKPNVDLGLLSQHSEGVIALTGCLASRFCRRLVDDNPAEARAHADDLIQIFGPEDVYFELQVNGIADQDKANEGIARIAAEVGRPVVGTADVHYLTARRPPEPLGPAVRPDQVDARRAEDAVRHERVLSQGQRRDGVGVRPLARGRAHVAGDRRALRRRDRDGRAAHPEVPDAGRLRRGGLPAPPRARGAARPATATRRRPKRSSGSRWSSA